MEIAQPKTEAKNYRYPPEFQFTAGGWLNLRNTVKQFYLREVTD